MKHVLLEVFSAEPNKAVIKAPGRRFPGVLVQGDTLSGLVGQARNVLALARRSENAGLVDVAQALAQSLGDLIRHYEQVLAEHNIPLPYSSPLEG